MITTNVNTVSIFGPPCDKVMNTNPEWRTQIAKGQDAGTNYHRDTQVGVPDTASCTVLHRTAKYFVATCKYRGIGPVSNTEPFIPGTTGALALERLRRKLKKRVGSAEAMVPVAESREVIKLVKQMTTMTETLLTTLIDIKRTRGRSALKWASQAWLAYGFGIRPLVDDTQGIARSISDYFSRSNAGIRESGIAKEEWISGEKYGPNTGCSGANLYHDVRHVHELSSRIYCGGVLDVESAEDYGIMEHLGFSSKKLIPTFWELVPYSWVVDYFVNVGTFLDNTFWVLPGSMRYSGHSRIYKRTSIVTSYFKPVSSDYIIVHQKAGLSRVTRSTFDRFPYAGSLPYASLRFKVRDEMGYYGIQKVLNMASVLLQRR